MSDWGDSCDENSVDEAQEPSPEINWRRNDAQSENENVGVRAARRGRTDERGAREADTGDRGRISQRSRDPGQSSGDFHQPLIFTVGNRAIGSIIGMLQLLQLI